MRRVNIVVDKFICEDVFLMIKRIVVYLQQVVLLNENVFCLFGDRTKERLKREEKRVEERKDDKG
jgi:hypothetical protein